MTMADGHDPMDVALAGVTPLIPNGLRAEAVRRRCRARLVRRAPSVRRPNMVGGSSTAVAMPMLLALFAALYAAALLSTTLRIAGWLP
jgi:hypothetical protein